MAYKILDDLALCTSLAPTFFLALCPLALLNFSQFSVIPVAFSQDASLAGSASPPTLITHLTSNLSSDVTS